MEYVYVSNGVKLDNNTILQDIDHKKTSIKMTSIIIRSIITRGFRSGWILHQKFWFEGGYSFSIQRRTLSWLGLISLLPCSQQKFLILTEPNSTFSFFPTILFNKKFKLLKISKHSWIDILSIYKFKYSYFKWVLWLL